MSSHQNSRGTYTYKGSGTNKDVRHASSSIDALLTRPSQGNHWCSRDYGPAAANDNPYHYSNRDGSYYYSNPDGSRYYNDGKGEAWFKSPGDDNRREAPRPSSSQQGSSSKQHGPSPSMNERSLSPENPSIGPKDRCLSPGYVGSRSGNSQSSEDGSSNEGGGVRLAPGDGYPDLQCEDEHDVDPSGYDSGRDGYDSHRLEDDCYGGGDYDGAEYDDGGCDDDCSDYDD